MQASAGSVQHFANGDWLRIGQAGGALARNAQGELFTGDDIVRKYRDDGSLLWCAPVAGDHTLVVLALDDGGVLAAGERTGSCATARPNCFYDFLTRLDADGGEVWSRSFSPNERFARVTGLAQADGLIYVAGQLDGVVTFQGEKHAREPIDSGFFVLALDEDGSELKWVDGFFPGEADGPVLAAHPDGGVIAAGHGSDSSVVRAYTAAGEKRWEDTLRGHVSLMELSVDGRGNTWTAGVLRGSLQMDQARTLEQTRGEFATVVLEYAPDGTPRSSQLFETPTTGGVRALGLTPREEGVFLISDHGYPSDFSKLETVTTRFGTIDAEGRYEELESFQLLSSFCRHAAVTAGNSIVWTGKNLRPTTFGLEQAELPSGSFLMQRFLP